MLPDGEHVSKARTSTNAIIGQLRCQTRQKWAFPEFWSQVNLRKKVDAWLT